VDKCAETHRYEGNDFLAIFYQLHTHTFPDGRVGLFCFDADFLEYDAFSMRRSTCWGGLVDVSEGTLFVSFVCLMNLKDKVHLEDKKSDKRAENGSS
jgi:hypothetical protein